LADTSEAVYLNGKPSVVILYLSGRLSAEIAGITSTDRTVSERLTQYLPGP
jgi:hypothetical protein